MAWNVAGELCNPKNITVGLNNPLFVTNAAFHSSPSLICTLSYPHQRSSLVKNFDPFRFIMRSDMSGNGYTFGFVYSFRYQQSWHGRKVLLSFLGTKKNSEDCSDFDCWIYPF